MSNQLQDYCHKESNTKVITAQKTMFLFIFGYLSIVGVLKHIYLSFSSIFQFHQASSNQI